jgi:hypothetical protein
MKTLLIRLAFGVIALSTILGTGCGSDACTPDAYRTWIGAHKDALSTQISHSGLSFSLTYLPVDWLALQETTTDNALDFNKIRETYSGMEYYRLRVSLAGAQGDILQYQATSQEEYYQRVEYFSFGMQQDLRMLNGQDTLPCKLFHFERNYGAAPFADFMIGFEDREGNKSDRVLIYNDRVYSTSIFQLSIPAENIQNIPKLKL